MNAVARAFPAAPALAAWWRQLAFIQPRALWVADLLLHRVDALVRVDQPCHADPLSLRILAALADAPAIEALQRQTGLQRQFLHQALTRLRGEGLIAPRSCELSALGRQTLKAGSYGRASAERRTFYFRAAADTPPQFLPVRGLHGEPCPPAASWSFDIAILDDCLQRPTEWKTRHGFPTDVARLETPGNDWRHVAVDTPVRLTAALVLAGDKDELRGFAYSSADWTLNLAQPVFAPGTRGADAFPELAVPEAEELATAWREWCLAHDCSETEAMACRLEWRENRLRVAAPPPLKDRLDAGNDDAWILVGKPEIRRAVQFEVEEG